VKWEEGKMRVFTTERGPLFWSGNSAADWLDSGKSGIRQDEGGDVR